MTLVMYDSIYPSTLPAGADAYLGYVDGRWPTCATVRAQFPGKPVICLTVTGATLNADGCDIETGDLGPASGAQWLKNKLATNPPLPPVAYCSVDNMQAVVNELAALGVNRNQVRLLSAHYNYVPHICGPDSCNKIDLPQDGTQWTNLAQGTGAQIDQSQLNDNFFQENEMITIPNVPGQWLSVQILSSADGSKQVAVGLGLDGTLWQVVRTGGAWGTPVAL